MVSQFYEYKKESLNLKFSSARDTLQLMQGAIKEYKATNSVYIKRAIIAYFQDFSEYIIDMAETYLVITENYVDGCSGGELINKSHLYGFIDSELADFLTVVLKLRNRYTHDYYKRDRVENDILDFSINKMDLLQIFIKITEEKIKLDAKF